MGIIFQEDDLIIKNENTLILGADILTKRNIKKHLERDYSVIDNTFSYSTKTVGETIENYNLDLKLLSNISSKLIKELTFEEYYYLAILLKINANPQILVVDNVFGYLNLNQRESIIKVCKKNNIHLIVFDNKLYSSFMSYTVIVIHNQKLAIKGKFKEVVKEEKILKRLGYELPFYVDLSTQLMLYGLIGNVCYSLEELEENLWN